MKVLMITGDERFGPGNERYELQRAAVDELAVVYWGRGSLWPKIPEGKFDVVTVQDPLLRGMFAWHAANKIEARFNVQVHMDLHALPWWKYMIAKYVLRHADSIRAVSEKIKIQVEHIAPRAKISVLPVFVDIEPFRTIVRVPHEAQTILWLGRFESEKDPLFAADIFREIVTKLPDAQFIFLGTGSLEKELRQRTQGLKVEFAGWQDPKPYLAKADVVLSTSRHESWGVSIVEALAAGVPVVAPDVGVAKEAGAIVVSREKLANAVLEVLQSPQPCSLRLKLLSREAWTAAWKKSL